MTEVTKPMVSICCITYNHAPFIRDAIDGFLKQKTDFEVEIIIHDDASTDSTAGIILEYENKYPDLIFPIYQTENQYSKVIKPYINFVFPRARGKYIALCEGDDFWTDPYKLQKQVDLLEVPENRHLIAVATNASVCDKDGIVLIPKISSVTKNNIGGAYNLHDFFRDGHRYPTLTVLFRNELKSLNPVLKRFENPFFTDWILWVLLHLKGSFYYLDEVTGCYRINPNSVTHTVNRIARAKFDFVIRRQLKEYLPLEYRKYLHSNWHAYYKLAMAYKKTHKFIPFLFYSFISCCLNPYRVFIKLKERSLKAIN